MQCLSVPQSLMLKCNAFEDSAQIGGLATAAIAAALRLMRTDGASEHAVSSVADTLR
jgi:hypothetical protein